MHINGPLQFLATTARGIEPILEEELRSLGAGNVRPTGGGVHFSGTMETALRACLWSRTASRILLPIRRSPVASAGDIYDAAGEVPWEEHLSPESTMAVTFSGTGSGISNTMFGAQRVKDAVADRFRRLTGRRPSVDTVAADFRIHCHLSAGELEIRIDLSGESLHRRGYRLEARLAPMKENLAAAILLKSGWSSIASGGGTFIDPLCGSGTLVIEAAMIAADAAPGLFRIRWGFLGWQGHDRALWQSLMEEARCRLDAGLRRSPKCFGFDADPAAISAAVENGNRAGIMEVAHFEKRPLSALKPSARMRPGLVLTNPPYGRRLGSGDDLGPLYAELGDALKRHFTGWSASVFTGDPELGKRMGLRAHRTNSYYNGALPCRLLQFRVEEEWFVDRERLDRRAADIRLEKVLERWGDAFMNRLKRNLRVTGRRARRGGIDCYRLYDWDLPEYPLCIDVYGDAVLVRPCGTPDGRGSDKSSRRMEDALVMVAAALEVDAAAIVVAGGGRGVRRPGAGGALEVHEGAGRFTVNLYDGTGLPLEERSLRETIASLATGKRFLNLCCGTATATVAAGFGGAAATMSVERDAVVIDAARRNMALNGFTGDAHLLSVAECIEWIASSGGSYDLILLNLPPREEPRALIDAALSLLAPGGVALIAGGPDTAVPIPESHPAVAFEDISRRLLPFDFSRTPDVFRCWRVTRSGDPVGIP
ncbi:MAG: bifunctional 23S rRNA (guanine(2069)-N(7))-methyltransferase RlmK/23S rRNA (guanine(2445)-N(2))-methyltransferase RlmL [Spirochaetes bacterium]|nr:bifunctional 23S rRNA (guanine(2069)-N(7))-methyltransferase RlmK/23S rRNA (guanine(2445)-N(2))-methyltransferase RlmL [Spirochaetota bacterium]